VRGDGSGSGAEPPATVGILQRLPAGESDGARRFLGHLLVAVVDGEALLGIGPIQTAPQQRDEQQRDHRDQRGADQPP
jgi:hypothetical protein